MPFQSSDEQRGLLSKVKGPQQVALREGMHRLTEEDFGILENLAVCAIEPGAINPSDSLTEVSLKFNDAVMEIGFLPADFARLEGKNLSRGRRGRLGNLGRNLLCCSRLGARRP